MLANDLAQVLRNAGNSVTEVAGWQTHNHGQLTAVNTVVIHHTAGAATGDYPSLGVVRNGRSDLPGPLAQLGVGRSGLVYVISSGLTYHAGAVLQTSYDNAHAIGIEVESVGDGTPWPAVQVQAVARAAAAICRRYGLPASRVLGHKEVCSPVGRKIDPRGIPGDMAALRSLVQQYLNNSVTQPEGEDMSQQDVDNLKGFLYSGGPSTSDGNPAIASNSVMGRIQNVESFLWKGGPSTEDDNNYGVSPDSVMGRLKATEVTLDEVKAQLDHVVELLNTLTARP